MAKRKRQSAGSCSEKVKKRKKRLSSLPVNILEHILSYLPSHDAVKTCVLSKTWRYIWSSVHSVDLTEKLIKETGLNFYKFVDTLLLNRQPSSIQKFRLYLRMERDDKDSSELNRWIIYALRHNVQVVDIDLLLNMRLTHQMFTCESLRELKLGFNHLCLPNFICLPLLRALHFDEVTVEAGQIGGKADLFSAMPSLETLILEDCKFDYPNLFISCCRLKKLILKNCEGYVSVEISAPNLMSLELATAILGKNHETIRFNSNPIHLNHASIRLSTSCFESMSQLFPMLKNTHSLTLSSLFLSSFAAELQNDPSIPGCIESPFYNLRTLKLGTSFSDGETLAIQFLLDHTAKVESIVLENKKVENDSETNTGECFEADKVFFKDKLSHLKSVEFNGFQGTTNEIKFVEFFLENAIVLETLIIIASRNSGSGDKNEMTTIGTQLRTLPRASSSVLILLYI